MWRFKGEKGDMRIFGWQFKDGEEVIGGYLGGSVRCERADMKIFGWQFKGRKGGYEDSWVEV